MEVYYFTVLFVFVMAFLSELSDSRMAELKEDGSIKHGVVASFFFVMVIIGLILVSGNRYYVGTDFGGYYKLYEIFAEKLADSIKTYDEPGFKFICWIVVQLKGDGHDVIMISSIITLFLYLVTLYKNTDKQLMASLLFIFVGCWHVSFNAVRQCMAAAVLFTGISALRNKKFFKYAVIVFIASLFHKTSLLMIVVYFVVNRSITVKNVSILILSSFVILTSFDAVMDFTTFFLEDAHSEELEYTTNSVNILRVLVACVPPLYVGLTKWRKDYNERETFAMNLLLLNAMVLVATSNSTYLARMSLYTNIFVVVSLPEMLRLIEGKLNKFVNIVVVVLYGAYWFYEVYNSTSLNPFKFIGAA